MRQQFNNMNSRQQDQQPGNAQGPTPNAQREGTSSGTSKVGEYIDFEEVK